VKTGKLSFNYLNNLLIWLPWFCTTLLGCLHETQILCRTTRTLSSDKH
jgi:hypothetical protein